MTHSIFNQGQGTKPMLEMLFQIKSVGLVEPVPELKFDSERKWRFDFAWPDKKTALEIEGGIFNKGRHIRPQGFLKDLEKYNRATELGWKLYRVTPQMVSNGEAIALLERVLK